MNRGRKKPYTARGISRVPCARCGRPSSAQWIICANDELNTGVCKDCDYQLNKLVLEFMGFDNVKELMSRYKEAKSAGNENV